MSDQPKIHHYPSLQKLVVRLRDDFRSGDRDFILLFAYNGTGKTRLSMAFKNAGKKKLTQPYVNEKGEAYVSEKGEVYVSETVQGDTLYFNAFTEDLFSWDNDLPGDSRRVLEINSASRFFGGLKELVLEESIQSYLGRYTDLDFDIDYTAWSISFSKGEAVHIKASRGEQNIFIWCLFMALSERVIDGLKSYEWVKFIYIDDPISSLDDNNTIAVASDLAKLLRRAKDRTKLLPFPSGGSEAAERSESDPIKVVVSSHHALFFNVVFNELKTAKCKHYFLHRPNGGSEYTLRATDETPFFHHVAVLSELRKAADLEAGKLYTYHFNMLRSILEKTATFFGKKDFSECLDGVTDEALYARALNLLSHGKYSLYEPVEMLEDNKQLFRDILDAFLAKHAFSLPKLLSESTVVVPANSPAPTGAATT